MTIKKAIYLKEEKQRNYWKLLKNNFNYTLFLNNNKINIIIK